MYVILNVMVLRLSDTCHGNEHAWWKDKRLEEMNRRMEKTQKLVEQLAQTLQETCVCWR